MKLTVFLVALPLVAATHLAAADNDPTASLRAWLGDKPGGVALAVIDRDGTHFFAAGQFSRANANPVDAGAFFEIGSLTKTFTALLLTDAVQRGEVKLDDTISTRAHVEVPAPITFQELATHHSGLPRLAANFSPSNPRDPYADQDEAKLWAALKNATLREHGMRFEYSNFGAAVLGNALASVAGRSYAGLLRERVLLPLGMDATALDWRAVERTRLAPGHAGGEPTPNWTFAAYAPSGAIVSTARDMARYVEVALGIRESSVSGALATCLEPRADMDQPNMRIGLAWVVEIRPDNSTITWHNGGTGGYRSFVGFDRTARIGVVLLTNHDSQLEPLAFALLAGQAFQAPTVTHPPPAPELAPYVGRYPLSPSFVMKVTAEGSQLFVQATGQSQLALKPDGIDRFAVVGVDAKISFVRNATGAVEALILHQNGIDQRAPRRDRKEPARTGVTLDATTLAEYAGTYPLTPAFVLTVTVEGGALFVQATGQSRLPVFAEAKDRFFYKVVDARITFDRGADGKVSGLVLHQNGANMPAKNTAP